MDKPFEGRQSKLLGSGSGWYQQLLPVLSRLPEVAGRLAVSSLRGRCVEADTTKVWRKVGVLVHESI